MLVLSRKVGEELVIGDNIRVVINQISGNRVTVGIVAPSDVRIIRGELQAIRDEFEKDEPRPAPLSEGKTKTPRLPGGKRIAMDSRPSILAFSSSR
jgi:carbon storage regulator